MSMQSQIIPSGRARRGDVAGTAIVVTTVVLGIMALLGTDLAVVALIALVVLGSILILTDRSPRTETHILPM
jgi:cell division protein FtsW (lipid II flippase)